ncbi:MAG: DUF937 domain-containing protein [Nonlabens sp.]|jgi:hypothetical protein|uniref:DUF937 domain-containing protein n=1 Tax=Nonlabens sp. TaxID=1888209 RepID=UPI00321972F1
MASILALLQSEMGQTLIQGVSKKSVQSSDKTTNVLSQTMPVILGAMQRNAATPEGAQSLNKALNDPRYSGGDVMDNLCGIFGDGAGSAEQLKQDGAGILGHVLGVKQKQATATESNGIGDLLGSVLGQSGTHDQSFIEQILDADGDGSIIDNVAGMVLGGDKKKSGLGGMLGGLFGK